MKELEFLYNCYNFYEFDRRTELYVVVRLTLRCIHVLSMCPCNYMGVMWISI